MKEKNLEGTKQEVCTLERETDKGKFTVLIEFRNIFPHIYLYVIAGPNDGTQLAEFF